METVSGEGEGVRGRANNRTGAVHSIGREGGGGKI